MIIRKVKKILAFGMFRILSTVLDSRRPLATLWLLVCSIDLFRICKSRQHKYFKTGTAGRGITVCDAEYQVQSMLHILFDELNQSALMEMKVLSENYGVT